MSRHALYYASPLRVLSPFSVSWIAAADQATRCQVGEHMAVNDRRLGTGVLGSEARYRAKGGSKDFLPPPFLLNSRIPTSLGILLPHLPTMNAGREMRSILLSTLSPA